MTPEQSNLPWNELVDILSAVSVISFVGFCVWIGCTLLLLRDPSDELKEFERRQKAFKRRLKRWKQLRRRRINFTSFP